MSNIPPTEKDLQDEEKRPPDEEISWFERLLQSFGLGEEPDCANSSRTRSPAARATR